jgi:hypothetical protein
MNIHADIPTIKPSEIPAGFNDLPAWTRGLSPRFCCAFRGCRVYISDYITSNNACFIEGDFIVVSPRLAKKTLDGDSHS